jgi:arsenate reductase (glutaredoxin)
MSNITFYGYKKCSTCRKAEKALEAAGVAYTFVDITEKPPVKSGLKAIIQQSGLPLRKAFNTSGEVYKAMSLKDKLDGMTEDAMMTLLASQGRLMKRPMVTDGKKATIGFDEKVFGKTWK